MLAITIISTILILLSLLLFVAVCIYTKKAYMPLWFVFGLPMVSSLITMWSLYLIK